MWFPSFSVVAVLSVPGLNFFDCFLLFHYLHVCYRVHMLGCFMFMQNFQPIL